MLADWKVRLSRLENQLEELHNDSRPAVNFFTESVTGRGKCAVDSFASFLQEEQSLLLFWRAFTNSLLRDIDVEKEFDIFLSHNSRDKSTVRKLAEMLHDYELDVWFDEWELIPGRRCLQALDEVISNVKAVAVLVGGDGLGSWQRPEMESCLRECVRRDLPVIPVLLPDAGSKPELPLFLRDFVWVDLRDGLTPNGVERLVWGITGQNPKLYTKTSPHTAARRKRYQKVILEAWRRIQEVCNTEEKLLNSKREFATLLISDYERRDDSDKEIDYAVTDSLIREERYMNILHRTLLGSEQDCDDLFDGLPQIAGAVKARRDVRRRLDRDFSELTDSRDGTHRPYRILERLLHTLKIAAGKLEPTADTFRGLSEEAFRDVLLVPLESTLDAEGAALGEAKRGRGKTDITCIYKGKTVLIAECKFWKGPKSVKDAIDQLLGYSCWRDERLVLMVFNKEGEFSRVIRKVRKAVEDHEMFVKFLDRSDGDNNGTALCSLLRRPDDEARKHVLDILMFDLASGLAR